MCSLKEREKEFSDLQYELKEVQKELAWQREHSNPSNETDLFVPTMTGFVEATKAEFNALKALIAEMKLQYEETLQYFGEDPRDPSCPSTDEFFGIFSTFLVSFSVSVARGVVYCHGNQSTGCPSRVVSCSEEERG